MFVHFVDFAVIQVTLAQVFQDQGAATAMVGKWHLGAADVAATPTKRGFDRCENACPLQLRLAVRLLVHGCIHNVGVMRV